MGDMADYYIDLGLDQGWSPVGSRSRRSYRQPVAPSPPPKCRTCGEVCYWAKRGGNWLLMSNGAPHKCSDASIEAKQVEGFKG